MMLGFANMYYKTPAGITKPIEQPVTEPELYRTSPESPMDARESASPLSQVPPLAPALLALFLAVLLINEESE